MKMGEGLVQVCEGKVCGELMGVFGGNLFPRISRSGILTCNITRAKSALRIECGTSSQGGGVMPLLQRGSAFDCDVVS